MTSTVRIGDLELGPGAPLALIAGPCVIEDDRRILDHAKRVAEVADRRGVPFVYKASFDKANRTRLDSFRGPGLERGLELLLEVKLQTGAPILTDVHEVWQCRLAAEVAEVLQIPAYLCRQTDLIVAAARTGRVVNLKKGQFLAPDDLRYAVDKAEGAAGVLVTERGTCFGYHDLVVDLRGLRTLAALGPVVFDATHAVQRPGGGAGQSGGDRTLVRPLARAAVAFGVDALFLEVHPDPERAPSDGANSVDDRELEKVLEDALAVRRALSPPGRRDGE